MEVVVKNNLGGSHEWLYEYCGEGVYVCVLLSGYKLLWIIVTEEGSY